MKCLCPAGYCFHNWGGAEGCKAIKPAPARVGQSKKHSWYEAWLNVFVGCGVALGSQLIIFPLLDIHITLATDLWITFWFTLISLARSYCLRRLFNWMHMREAT